MNLYLTRALLLAPLILVTACGGGGDGPQVAGADVRGNHNHSVSAQQSTNWAGYAVAGAPAGFIAVQGTWIVPAIAPSSHDTASSTWAGVGGGCGNPPSCTETDPTLIQAGIESDNSGGSPQYSAWWEALPGPSVTAMGSPLSTSSYDVRPGDSITVTISSDLAVWTIEIEDVRDTATKWTFTTTVPYLSAGLTAEWIEESPLTAGTSGAGQITLSDFGQVNFTNLMANSANPNLMTSDAIELVNSKGKVIAIPSAPGSGGDSFSVCFGSGPCP